MNNLGRLLLAALVVCGLQAAPMWKLAKSEHFEVYAQSDEVNARAVLTWFEQLRSFFAAQSEAKNSTPARIVVFESREEYRPYQLRPLADAYYVGMGSRNYIVMAGSSAREFTIAAHEYAHLVLRAAGLHLPPWLNEGLAEFFSTVRVTGSVTELGASLPGRLQVLTRQPWIPLDELLAVSEESTLGGDRARADVYYAQCWALTEMLLRSPVYSPHFPELLAALGEGTHGSEALSKIYSHDILHDLHVWVEGRRPNPIRLAGVDTSEVAVQVSDLDPLAARLLLADVLFTANELDRAEAMYRGLGADAPAEAAAALGAIALRRGDSAGARRAWKQAIALGVKDADVCYHYAILADQAGLAPDEIRPALERAIALQPDFDDARYQLALLEKNAGRYDAALLQFLAMRTVSSARAYAYWMAIADSYNELGKRDEAKAAAREAAAHAATPDEKSRAAQQAYIADTDADVQFVRDGNGRLQLVTTRVPHETKNRNPFIEAGDDFRSVEATLQEVECSGTTMRIHLIAAGQPLTLAVPEPARVQMRNAPAEFVCGPQEKRQVLVEYAARPNADGLLRGMEFR